MYEYYGVYKACRDAAWRCQIDFGVNRLPVKVLGIARAAGIRVVRNSIVNELRPGEAGVSITDGSVWTVIYDDSRSIEESRVIVAHELGHIFLGHEHKYGGRRFGFSGIPTKSEREADLFAMRLLAPACILHELSLLDPDGIAALCGIPHELAEERAKRMVTLEKRGSFYRSQLESDAKRGFDSFLQEYRERKNDHLPE